MSVPCVVRGRKAGRVPCVGFLQLPFVQAAVGEEAGAQGSVRGATLWISGPFKAGDVILKVLVSSVLKKLG